MKEFFKSLLTEGGYSSKRFTALICLGLFVSIVICSLCGIKVENEILYDETFTNTSDTIYDTGNPYLYNPPFKKSVTTKVISLSSGTINYSFLTAEFGDAGYGTDCEMWVKVYSGIGVTKTLLKTFNLANKPSGTYIIPNNKATIEIYSGCNGGNTRGIAIKYWKL